MELHTTIAVFFCRFDFELYDTKPSDMVVTDRLAPVLGRPPKVKIIKDYWDDDLEPGTLANPVREDDDRRYIEAHS